MATSRLATLWLRTFLAGFAVIAGLAGLAVSTPDFYGDLTRVGPLSERAFGWQGRHPVVADALLQDAPLGQADVLVVGDSFSLTRRWQSVLVGDGLKVATTEWPQYGGALCADFDSWLARTGFRGRLVIVETVERLVGERLRASADCATMTARPYLPPPPPRELPEPRSPWALNPTAPLAVGWRTLLNTRQAERATGDLRVGHGAVVRAVPDGCQRFSHRLCQKALFFADDMDHPELGADDAARLEAVARRIRTPLLWVIVPDKSTVYLAPDHARAFREAFAGSGRGPDVFAFAAAQRTDLRDFYLPNDTHLSVRGELRLGAFLLPHVRGRMASAP